MCKGVVNTFRLGGGLTKGRMPNNCGAKGLTKFGIEKEKYEKTIVPFFKRVCVYTCEGGCWSM